MSINSTEGIRAVLRKKIVIQLQLAKLIERYPEVDLLSSPPIIKQSAITITDPQKLTTALNSFLEGSLQSNTKNHTTEKAIPKVLNAIKSILTTQ